MTVLKQKRGKIKSFQFGELVPSEDGSVMNSDSFELKSLNAAQDFKHNITEGSIRAERDNEAATAFSIDNMVKEHRGLNRQAAEDYEQAVAAEVAKRVEALKEQAYDEGFQKGLAEGEEKAYGEATTKFEAEIDNCAEKIARLQEDAADILAKSKDDAYRMVRNLTKWVILKEVDEKYYLARLLEKLIHEINSKTNLVLHVNQESFGYIPEIIKIVERKVGKLTNVRVEADLDMKENGIMLESENTIIDGSLKAQFESIDKLFLSVGLNE